MEPLKIRIEVDDKPATAPIANVNKGAATIGDTFRRAASIASSGVDSITSRLSALGSRAAQAARQMGSEFARAAIPVRNFVEELNRAPVLGAALQRLVSGPLGQIGRIAQIAGTGVAGLSAAAAIGAVSLAGLAASAVFVALKFGAAAEQIQNNALVTGLGVKGYQELARAAEDSGTNAGALITVTRKLNEALSENSSEGRKAKAALADIGVTSTDSLGRVRPLNTIIEEVATHLGAVEDPAKKARLAFQLFGRGFKDILPVLAQYPELIQKIRASGVIISDEDVKRAGEFDNKMDDIKRRIEALVNLAKNKILIVIDTVITGPAEKILNSDGATANQFTGSSSSFGGGAPGPAFLPGASQSRSQHAFNRFGLGASSSRTEHAAGVAKANDILAGNSFIDATKRGSIEALEATIAASKDRLKTANQHLTTGNSSAEARERVAAYNKERKNVEDQEEALDNLKFALQGGPRLQAQAQSRSTRLLESAKRQDAGGFRALEIQRDETTRELSTRIDSKGRERQVTLEAKTRANIEQTFEENVRRERRKTADDLRTAQLRLNEDRIRADIDVLHRTEAAEDQSLELQVARETITRRSAEDQRLELKKATIKKVADLEISGIAIAAGEEIRQKQKQFDREKSTNAALAAEQARVLAQQIGIRQAKAQEAIKKVRTDENAATSQATGGLDVNRTKLDHDAADKARDYRFETTDEAARHEIENVGRARDAQLDSLALIQARSIQQKVALEQAKLNVEIDYLQKSEALELVRRNRAFAREIELIGEQGRARGESQEVIAAAQDDAAARNGQRNVEANEDLQGKIAAATRRTQISVTHEVQDQQLKIFENLKHSIEGVLDETLSKSKSIWEAIGNAFKSAMLGAFKAIVASQVAAAFTKLITGANVTFSGGAASSSPTSGIGRILGGLGLGAPGVSGGVPITTPPIFPSGATGGAPSNNDSGGRSFTTFGGPIAQGGGFARYAGLLASAGRPVLGGPIIGGGGDGGYGGNGATPPIIPLGQNTDSTVLHGVGGTGIGGAAGSVGQIGVLGSLKGQLKGLGNIGSGFSTAHGGVNGAGGGALLAGGGILAYDGLRRGGLLGLGETIAGGAAIGFKFGGPIGAAIGAGIGAVAGTIRLFIHGFDEQVVDQVKKLYGINISKQFAKRIADIAKQNYGGSISTAIRSPEVVQLLSLYAQASGQQFGITNTPHAAAVAQRNGSLQQTAGSYQNGQGIGFQSSLSSDSTISRYIAAGSAGAPLSVSLSLDPKQTANLWEGAAVSAIGNNPGAVASSVHSAALNSNGRRELTNLAVSPGLLLT